MHYRIIDFTGEFECDELKSYGRYMNPKFKFKTSPQVFINLMLIFGPFLLILNKSEIQVCLKIKHSFILMDEETFLNVFYKEHAFSFHQALRIRSIGKPLDVVLSVAHSICKTGELHVSLVDGVYPVGFEFEDR
jgi:hypothetical protein